MKDHNMTDYAKLEEYWVSNVVNITEENNFDYIVWEEVNKKILIIRLLWNYGLKFLEKEQFDNENLGF